MRHFTSTDAPWLLLAWLAAVVIALATREPAAVAETRHLAVAWEMWRTGEWLVPHLNGEPYGRQPPLLYWLIHAGWAVAGVNDAWPRALTLLLGLVGSLLVALLARRLWPANLELPGAAALLASGTLLWAGFATVIAADLLLAVTTLVALLGLVALTGTDDPRVRRRAGALLAAGLGLGLLAHGPAALLHVAVPALLAPWWSERVRAAPGRHAGALLVAVAVAVALAAVWAVPAALSGGGAYAYELLASLTFSDGQHAGFATEQRWIAAAVAPLVLLPWIAWTPAMVAVRDGWRSGESSVRFCAALVAGSVALFALSGARQLHWLLPAVPALALVVGRGVTLSYATSWRADRFWPVLPLGVLAALLAIAGLATQTGSATPWLPGGGGSASWLASTLPWWPLAALTLIGWTLAPLRLTPVAALRRVHVAVVVGVALVAAALQGSPAGRSYDVAPASLAAQAFEQRGQRLAIIGPYHGEFHFAGRLARPVVPLSSLADLQDFAAAAPGSIVAVHSARDPGMMAAMPIAAFAHRNAWVSFWPAARLATEPRLRERLAIRFPSPEAG